MDMDRLSNSAVKIHPRQKPNLLDGWGLSRKPIHDCMGSGLPCFPSVVVVVYRTSLSLSCCLCSATVTTLFTTLLSLLLLLLLLNTDTPE